MISKYKDVILSNLKMYCRKSGNRIGKIEKDIGVSTGYFSRLHDNFSLSVLEKLEDITGMSIAELCRKPKLFTLKLEIYSLSESDADCMNRKILEICNHNGNKCCGSYVPEEGEMK